MISALTNYKNASASEDAYKYSPRHKHQEGWEIASIVMETMVLLVLRTEDSLPHPSTHPTQSALFSELQCCFSGDILHIFCVFSQFLVQSVSLHECFNDLVSREACRLFIVVHVCFICVVGCLMCDHLCAAGVCVCVLNAGTWCLCHKGFSSWFLWRNFHPTTDIYLCFALHVVVAQIRYYSVSCSHL